MDSDGDSSVGSLLYETMKLYSTTAHTHVLEGKTTANMKPQPEVS